MGDPDVVTSKAFNLQTSELFPGGVNLFATAIFGFSITTTNVSFDWNVRLGDGVTRIYQNIVFGRILRLLWKMYPAIASY